MSDRESKLLAWAVENLPAGTRLPARPALTATAGDAGFRRYWRIDSTPSWLVVYAPPEHEDSLAFVRKAHRLRAAGVRAPAIAAVDFGQGFLLVEDFGHVHALDQLDAKRFESIYDLADGALLALQSCPADATVFPPYDADKLRAEMRLFPEWFLGQLLEMPLDAGAARLIGELEQVLLESALVQPQVPVHRDYHARNLMVIPGEDGIPAELGVIDFQDAVIGPVTYDLVSLYRDCYIRWPRERISGRVRQYLDRAVAAGILPPTEPATFQRWFDLMGLQRHIKVLGIFARLWLRDGKHRYLADLPLVMRYVIEVARAHRVSSEFAAWFESEVVPRAERCSWYTPWQSAGDQPVEDRV